MKFTLIAATLTLVASAIAQNATVVSNNGMGGTKATASISVDGNNNGQNAANQLNRGILAITLTSVATAAYALL